MKRNLIGAIVGGIIIFLWQFVSFGLANLHSSAMGYTDKQDAIMNVLKEQQLPEGGYVIPSLPRTATQEQWEAEMENAKGKPWALVEYHNAMEDNMVMNMIRGLLVNIIMIYLFCWLIRRVGATTSFGTIFSAALVTGLIVFLNIPYINFIWMKSFDVWAHLLDAVVAWGITGLWLGWWLRRNAGADTIRMQKKEVDLVG